MPRPTGFEHVDFRKNPWRGVISEIAEEDGVTQQAVSDRVKRRSASTLRRVLAKVREREAVVSEFDELHGVE